jgi:hypothetical protein
MRIVHLDLANPTNERLAIVSLKSRGYKIAEHRSSFPIKIDLLSPESPPP